MSEYRPKPKPTFSNNAVLPQNRERSIVVTTVRTTTKRRSLRATPQPRPLPTDFICIDPDMAAQLFDYLNDADETVDKNAAAAHLALCFHCQEAVARLKKIKEF